MGLQGGEGARGRGEAAKYDRGRETSGTEAESQTHHQQGSQGKVQVLAEVLSQRSLLSCEFFGGDCWVFFVLFFGERQGFQIDFLLCLCYFCLCFCFLMFCFAFWKKQGFQTDFVYVCLCFLMLFTCLCLLLCGTPQAEEDTVLKRDFAQATLEDHFNKTVLPKVMQVKDFGRAGRTKYTHLVDQDTTQVLYRVCGQYVYMYWVLSRPVSSGAAKLLSSPQAC